MTSGTFLQELLHIYCSEPTTSSLEENLARNEATEGKSKAENEKPWSERDWKREIRERLQKHNLTPSSSHATEVSQTHEILTDLTDHLRLFILSSIDFLP